MKKVLIGLAASAFAIGSFAMTVGSANAATSYVFSNNLSVGSTGADVVALQSFLVSKGYLTIPAGVSQGYFGSLTKAAVVAYQTAAGIVPQSGYVGPLTRTALNGGAAVATAPSTGWTCPTGWTCQAPAGVTTTPSTPSAPSAGITTPGVQGIISVTQGPVSTSVANAGQTKVPVLDVRIQAQYSDVSVQSVQLDLGSSTSIYNFVYQTIYVVDPSTGAVLATVPLNSSTVVQNGNNYVVGLAGFGFVVPKGTYKDLVIEADLFNQINTQYANSTSWTVSVDQLGVRAVDGAGVNLYGPSGSSISQTMVIGQSLVTSATANISLDGASPLTGSVGVTNATQGQYLGLPVMIFDVNAQGDNLHLHSVSVGVANSGGGSVNAAYLYQGSTPIASASVSNGVATFNNISDGQAGAGIPVNTTVPFTVKVDVSGLTSGVAPAVVTASTTSLTIYTSIDSSAGISGSATSNAQTVFGAGPVISLAGAPTITNQNITPGGATTTTLKYTATFNVNLQAIGENVNFGLPSTTTAAFGTSSTAINFAELYINSAASSTPGTPVIAGYSQPTNTTLSQDASYFTLAQNQSVTVPVTYSWTVNGTNGNTYAVQLQGVQWFTSSNGSNATTTSFMKNQTAWRTPSL